MRKSENYTTYDVKTGLVINDIIENRLGFDFTANPLISYEDIAGAYGVEFADKLKNMEEEAGFEHEADFGDGLALGIRGLLLESVKKSDVINRNFLMRIK